MSRPQDEDHEAPAEQTGDDLPEKTDLYDLDTPAARAAEKTMRQVVNMPAEDLETELDVYPVRDKEEDPRWVIRSVFIWVGVVLLFIAFIVWLAIAGWACPQR